MLKSHYIEDIFIEFHDLVQIHGGNMALADARAAFNFSNLLENSGQLTQSQGNLILKILDKYKPLAHKYNLVYDEEIKDPKWKNEFRLLDLSKRIGVETGENGEIFIILKFPYHIKDTFEKEFPPGTGWGSISSWDPERKIRRVRFEHINIVALYEFAKKHQFEIEDSFIEAVETVENFWAEQDSLIPYSTIFENKIVLMNSNEYADEYFEKHSSGDLAHDMFLAKSMNFLTKLENTPKTVVEEISSQDHNSFWIKDFDKFFELYKAVNGKVCVILDRNTEPEAFIEKFVFAGEKNGVPRRDFRVCFRAPKEDKTNFNQWIKDRDLGGPVSDGKIFIFHHKPAKWLFKEEETIKIIVTTGLYPETNNLVKDWIDSHPCTVYLVEIKPTPRKGNKIVEL